MKRFWQLLKDFFNGNHFTYITSVSRPMTAKEAAAFDEILKSMDKLFKEINNGKH